MKTLKKYAFLALGLLIGFSSCKDGDDGDAEATLSFYPAKLELTMQGTSRDVTILTNQADWSFEPLPEGSWCKAEKINGKLRISATPNVDTNAKEEISILITAGVAPNSISEKLVVTQEGASVASLLLEPSTVEINKSGDAKLITVTTNQGNNWTFEPMPQGSWCIVEKVDATTLKVRAASKNQSGTVLGPVTVTVTAGSGTNTKTSTISVSQLSEDIFYEIQVPATFDGSWVQDVFDITGKKVAEICKEYVRSSNIDNQMVVVYPVENSGKTDLKNGFVAAVYTEASAGVFGVSSEPIHGGSVVWNTETNSCVYTAGTSAALTSLFIENGKIITKETDLKAPYEIKPSLLVDVRGEETISYPIVKIGTQYWMQEGLKATRYRNGNIIYTAAYTQELYESNVKIGVCGTYNEGRQMGDAKIDTETKKQYGLMYSAYAAGYNVAENTFDATRLAPKGWRVPTWYEVPTSDMNKLITYLGDKPGYKVKRNAGWGSEPGNNISGLTFYSTGLVTAYGAGSDSGLLGYAWVHGPDDPGEAYYMGLAMLENASSWFKINGIVKHLDSKSKSASVRCVKE